MTFFIRSRFINFLYVLALLIATNYPSAGYCRAFACATMPFDTMKFLEAVDEHVLCLREKNIPKAYYKYTDKEFQENTSLEEFTELVNRYAPLHDNQSIKLSSIQFYEEIGQYVGVITSSSGDTLMIEYQLSRKDKDWKILFLKLMQYVCDQTEQAPRRGKSTVSS